MSFETEFNEIIEETKSFINSVIAKKYLLPEESNYEDMIKGRFFDFLNEKEKDTKRKNKIKEMLLDRRLIPAGSILYGMGRYKKEKVTFSNCYYIPIEKDSLEGIYEARKKIAETFSRRGGVGTSITILRPKDEKVSNAAKTSSGAVSFMPGFSNLAYEIGQNGRRGALMIDIDCRHPDLIDFIWCKSKPDNIFPKDYMSGHQPDVNHANISVIINDDFMKAVKEDKDWDLFFPDIEFEKYNEEWDGNYDKWLAKGYPVKVYKTLKARDILKQIAESAWMSGDPGVLFKDAGQKYSSGYFDERLIPVGTNPCLPDWAPVLTPNGYKYFKDVKNEIMYFGSKYYCSDLIKTKSAAKIYEIKLETGQNLYCTGNHKILAKRNDEDIWVEAENITLGEEVIVDFEPIINIHNLEINESKIVDEVTVDLFDYDIEDQLKIIRYLLEKLGTIIFDKYYQKSICLVMANNEKLISQIQLVLQSIGIISVKQFSNECNLKILQVENVNKIFNLWPDILKSESILEKFKNNKIKSTGKVKDINILDKEYPVYDINVPEINRFISSGVVVHNCGEQWLQKWGNCLLSALVLYKYVKNPYTPTAEFDIDLFLDDVRHTVVFLDHIIDVNKDLHPLKEQRDTDNYSRRMGIEITGLNDMLAMLGYDYGSEDALNFISDIFKIKAIEEIKMSIELAKEKGPAPCLSTKISRERFIKQPYIQRLLNSILRNPRKTIIDNIMKYGLRNSAFNTIGPTGSISIIADNCTSGIEPIFEIEYFRESRLIPGKKNRMIHLPLAKIIGPKILELSKEEIEKKYHYTPAHKLDYLKRIKIQSTIQQFIDSSISSTVNLKNEATVDTVLDIYEKAHEHGLKGITIFRDGCKKGVLTLSNEEENKGTDDIINSEMIIKHLEIKKQQIDKMQKAYRYVRNWKGVKVYITITVDTSEKPIEVFANIPYEAGLDKNGTYRPELLLEKKSYWDSICRLLSMLLKLNVPLEKIISQLEKSSPTMLELSSILSHILKSFIKVEEEVVEKIKEGKENGNVCKECGKNGVIYQNGCSICVFCGASKCE